MLASFFRRCFQVLVPSCMKRQRTPSSPLLAPSDNERQGLLAASTSVSSYVEPIQAPQPEALVVSSDGLLVEDHQESTWNLDLLFSGSYLFQSAETRTSKTVRAKVKTFCEIKPKPRPTHFLAVKIDSPEILAAVGRAQADMIERFPQIEGAIIPASKLHVTLSVLYLPKPEDVEIVKGCLASYDWNQLFSSAIQQIPTLRLHGVGHFRDSVIYADFKHDGGKDALKQVTMTAIECIKAVCPSALIEEAQEEAGEEKDEPRDDEKGEENKAKRRRNAPARKKARDFHPHITLAKLSSTNFRKNNKKKNSGEEDKKNSINSKPMRKIDRKAHVHLTDFAFGEQSWDRLQLLAMQWPKKVKGDGYYFVESEFIFQQQK